jgi:hypothetical protein
MKTLHKSNLYCWSHFDEQRNIDFHSYLWVRAQGNIVFDPLPLSAHDKQHLTDLGKLTHIFISNSDHVRDAEQLARETSAAIYGPAAERDNFPIACSHWLSEGKNVEEGLDVYCLDGSKTLGELAFVVEGDTLITGDLIRAHAGGTLCMLPPPKLQNVEQAINSVKRLAAISGIKAVLPGDGWPIFREAEAVLRELIA